MRKLFNFHDFDWTMLGLALLIAAIGLLEIYSTTTQTPLAGQFQKQIYWLLLGCALTLIVSQLDYHLVLAHIPWIYLLAVLTLGGVLLVGPRLAGTHRWIQVGSFTLQVSELAKLVIILAVAAAFAKRRNRAFTWGELAMLGLLAGVPGILVALEPDLGTALTYLPIVAAGAFMAGIRRQQIMVLGLIGILALPAGWFLLRPYQRERLEAFVHPKQNTQGSSYQVTQTKIAIGSGGLLGRGLGNGTQSQLGFIPVSHADAIFAAFAEERGFIGTLAVFALYFILLLRLLEGARTATDRAGSFLLIGFASVLFFQVAVNVGMMIGLFPITGIPLPLMSEGGSSMLFIFLGLGLVMSVKMQRFVN
ncbi:MAG: rod shape-determining protein RodA [Acidobacteria bacterium]|nr:MAG: rod shape-determining protein RodA [Acidobacteriota bacterium]